MIAAVVDNDILIVGPVQVIKCLVGMLGTGEFYKTLGVSVLRITAGVLTGFLLGFFLAQVARRFNIIEEFLQPLVACLKSIPVASFVILVLIWAGNSKLAYVISSLVSFPISYLNILGGLKNTDAKLLEVGSVYKMSYMKQMKYIYLPAIIPQILTTLELTIGMGFKSGVAAEVIGQSLLSIGNEMYRAKIYLETDHLLAWTFMVIIVSKLVEILFKLIVKKSAERSGQI